MLTQTNAQLRRQRGDNVLDLVASGLTLSDNWSLRFLYARVLVDAGKYKLALAELALLTAKQPESLREEHLAHDFRIFGCQAHDLAGVAWLRLGDRAAAAAAFARAAALAPSEQAYRIKAMALGVAPSSARDA